MEPDELTALRAENAKLRQHLNEWWRVATAIDSAEPGTDAERAAWAHFDALRLGNGYADAGEPVAEWLTRERDRRDARIKELEAVVKRLQRSNADGYALYLPFVGLDEEAPRGDHG